ncbi:MAG: hypothetical protein JSR72_12875 [Proteobacteria bacterium]|nr:hypothetical protein [Pseudomonadota bacterium]
MSLCRAFTLSICLLPLAAGGALAQAAWPAPPQQQQAAPASSWPAAPGTQQDETAPPPPQQQQQATQQPAAAWPAPAQPAQSGAWPAPNASAAPPQQNFVPPPGGFGPSLGAPQQQAQEPPCFKDFMALRQEADKKGRALQEASKKKVPPPVACRLFNEYSASEGKLVKYVSTNATKCEIPKEVVENLTKNHAKTNEIRTKVCEVAAAGPPKPRGPSLSDALSGPVPDSSNVRTGRGGTFDTLSGGALGK